MSPGYIFPTAMKIAAALIFIFGVIHKDLKNKLKIISIGD
jgi:hypothetical protein